MQQYLLVLDIGSTTVKFINVVSNSKQHFPEIRSSGVLPISSDMVRDGEVSQPTALAADLKAGLKAAGVKTKYAALTVNSSRLILRQQNLPPLPIPQLKQLLNWELQRYTPYQSDTAEFDVLSIQLTPKHHTVLLAAVPKKIVASLFMTAQLAGLSPLLLEPGIMCLFRWIQYYYDISDKNTLILDLGVESSNILIATGGQPFIARTVLVTLDGIEGKQKMMAEIRRSLDFVQTHNHIGWEWYCFYVAQEIQEAMDSLLVTALEKDLNMTVQRLAIEPSLNIDSTVFAHGIGLSLGWQGGVNKHYGSK